MLVDHGPPQQSCKEEYKSWRGDATTRYNTSHTKTMLPTRKSMPRSSRQLDHTRPPDYHTEMQTEVIWTCLLSIRSGQNHLARQRVRGGRRQGRQKKRWEDNLREWIGLEFAESQRVLENSEKWRTLVVTLSVVPQRPLPLRDR